MPSSDGSSLPAVMCASVYVYVCVFMKIFANSGINEYVCLVADINCTFSGFRVYPAGSASGFELSTLAETCFCVALIARRHYLYIACYKIVIYSSSNACCADIHL